MGRRCLIALSPVASFVSHPFSITILCFPVSVPVHVLVMRIPAYSLLICSSLFKFPIVLLIGIYFLRRSIVVQVSARWETRDGGNINAEMNPRELCVHRLLRHCHVTFLLDLCCVAHLAH